jgi:hypothetical protein
MPTKLSTTVSKIKSIPNTVNGSLIEEFYNYMKDNDSSERHQNNALKVVIAYTKFLGSDITLYDVKRKEQIIGFLDTKIKPIEQIQTGNGLPHGITIYTESSICLGGYTIREVRRMQHHNQNGLHPCLPK